MQTGDADGVNPNTFENMHHYLEFIKNSKIKKSMRSPVGEWVEMMLLSTVCSIYFRQGFITLNHCSFDILLIRTDPITS